PTPLLVLTHATLLLLEFVNSLAPAAAPPGRMATCRLGLPEAGTGWLASSSTCASMAVLVRILFMLPCVPRTGCAAMPWMLAARPVAAPTVILTLAECTFLSRGSVTERVMVDVPAWLPAWKWNELPPELDPNVML